eukprot:XP_011677754.1 PREDICTED: uncharacterized protein LOC105444771 [Strongylocentrotus purpuratus]
MVCQKYLQLLCVILVTGLVRGQTTTGATTTVLTTDTPATTVVPDASTTVLTTDTPATTVVPDASTAGLTTETDDPIADPATSAPPELPTTGIILTCTPTQMIVEIPKSLLTGEMTGDDVCFENQLEDESLECRGKWKSSAANIIEVTTNLEACGTKMTH